MIKNVILIIVVFVLFVLWMRYFEHSSLYFPSRESSYTPDAFNLKYEDIFFKAKDGVQIHAWFIPARGINSESLTVLFCHGNGGNISHRISKIVAFNELGINFFIHDYRGYGRSQGIPSEAGIYLDTKAAYDYLVGEKGIPADKIIIYGESLGGAVAVDLAAKVKSKALILEGAFSSARDMAKRIYPLIPGFLIQSKFDSMVKIKNVVVPKLFIHSPSDEVIPIELSRKLFDQAPEPKIFTTIDGSHNLAFTDSLSKAKEIISEFIKSL